MIISIIIAFTKMQTIRTLALAKAIDEVTKAQIRANLAMSKFSLIFGAVSIGIMAISAIIGAFKKDTD